jgi:hypothetical protein
MFERMHICAATSLAMLVNRVGAIQALTITVQAPQLVLNVVWRLSGSLRHSDQQSLAAAPGEPVMS